MALMYKSQVSNGKGSVQDGCSCLAEGKSSTGFSSAPSTQYGYQPKGYLLTEGNQSPSCHYCEMIQAMKEIEDGCCSGSESAEANQDQIDNCSGGSAAEEACATTDVRFATDANPCAICPEDFQRNATQSRQSRPRLGKCRELEGDPRELRNDPKIENLVREIKRCDACMDRDSIYSLLEVAGHVKFLFDGVNMIRITTPGAMKRKLWANADLYSRIKKFAAEKAIYQAAHQRRTPDIDEPHAVASEKAVHRVIM